MALDFEGQHTRLECLQEAPERRQQSTRTAWEEAAGKVDLTSPYLHTGQDHTRHKMWVVTSTSLYPKSLELGQVITVLYSTEMKSKMSKH